MPCRGVASSPGEPAIDRADARAAPISTRQRHTHIAEKTVLAPEFSVASACFGDSPQLSSTTLYGRPSLLRSCSVSFARRPHSASPARFFDAASLDGQQQRSSHPPAPVPRHVGVNAVNEQLFDAGAGQQPMDSRCRPRCSDNHNDRQRCPPRHHDRHRSEGESRSPPPARDAAATATGRANAQPPSIPNSRCPGGIQQNDGTGCAGADEIDSSSCARNTATSYFRGLVQRLGRAS
eukprot:TRINITY_DN7477_c0_g1_i1.p2 TRINITY_DN7477_c0_g1~~TRINITY_DN7477_c0_g1_i1.p2  ORF type:complete len:236 (-),score=-37.57 TRINITY_DN7477_c0_g1_i1:324-1031(-)